jgi:phosphoesterase RecJ-like protein
MSSNGASDRQQVLAELRAARRLVVVTHENLDGDALGSLIAMQGILTALGKNCVMFIDPGEFPLPPEYGFFELPGLVTEHILNIDHHHDNTRFGSVNLIVPEASCTAEIIWDLMGDLEVSAALPIAEALYVALITDTGRFMYENTGPRAHLMAAELIEAGVDVAEIYRRVYEEVPAGKLALLARGLANVRRYDDGRLTVTSLTAEDFAWAEAEESYAEGLIDHLRALQGTAVAALVRDRIGEEDSERPRKVSLRSRDGRVDVSRIARVQGGGGHRQAAGFSTAMEWDELIGFLREEVAQQLGAPA